MQWNKELKRLGNFSTVSQTGQTAHVPDVDPPDVAPPDVAPPAMCYVVSSWHIYLCQ